MHSKIYIWPRTAIDWSDDEAWRNQVSPALQPKLALWNETFNIPFNTFRARVCEIAALNLSRVEGAPRARWDEIPNGVLVVPVDDDDWLAPDLARVLDGHQSSNAPGYHWIASFVEVPFSRGHALGLLRRRLFPRTPPRWICSTNNYAMVKEPDNRELLGNHTRASRWFESEGAGRVRRIDQRLSVMNRTLGSQTTLGVQPPAALSRAQLLRKFRRYRTLYRGPVPHELVWCQPYMDLMADLMDTLELRR